MDRYLSAEHSRRMHRYLEDVLFEPEDNASLSLQQFVTQNAAAALSVGVVVLAAPSGSRNFGGLDR